MARARFSLSDGQPKVVGSLGKPGDLAEMPPSTVRDACDIIEIRLDLMQAGHGKAPLQTCPKVPDFPLLFTARRMEEGGALPLSAAQRIDLLTPVLDQAAWLDIEVASIEEMAPLLQDLAIRDIPWLASFHDFSKLPDESVLQDAVQRAQDAGASAFKLAAMLHQPADLTRLAEFQLADHGLPVASMGMGPLAAVSRLLCAQCGSVLNYGYLGKSPTAPGQWDAALMRQAIARLIPLTIGRGTPAAT